MHALLHAGCMSQQEVAILLLHSCGLMCPGMVLLYLAPPGTDSVPDLAQGCLLPSAVIQVLLHTILPVCKQAVWHGAAVPCAAGH